MDFIYNVEGEHNIQKVNQAGLQRVRNFEQAMIDDYFMPAWWEKETGIISSYCDQGAIEGIFNLAAYHNVVRSSIPLRPRDFVTLARWCKSPVGRKLIDEHLRIQRLKRKAGKLYGIGDVAAVEIMEVALQDMGNEIRDESSYREKQIKEARRAIQHHMNRMEEIIELIKEEFSKVSEYHPLPEHEIIGKYWTYFCHEYQGGDPPKAPENFRRCIHLYEQIAQRERRVNLCQSERVKAWCREYGNKKIAQFAAMEDEKKVSTFRALVALNGGRTPVDAADWSSLATQLAGTDGPEPKEPTEEAVLGPAGPNEDAVPATRGVLASTVVAPTVPYGALSLRR